MVIEFLGAIHSQSRVIELQGGLQGNCDSGVVLAQSVALFPAVFSQYLLGEIHHKKYEKSK